MSHRQNQKIYGIAYLLLSCMTLVDAFVVQKAGPSSAFLQQRATSSSASSSVALSFSHVASDVVEFPSQSVAAVDLAGFLSENLVGFISSPAILLLPVGVALSIGAVVAYFLISSANPTVLDNQDD